MQPWFYPVVKYCFNAICFTRFIFVNSVIVSSIISCNDLYQDFIIMCVWYFVITYLLTYIAYELAQAKLLTVAQDVKMIASHGPWRAVFRNSIAMNTENQVETRKKDDRW